MRECTKQANRTSISISSTILHWFYNHNKNTDSHRGKKSKFSDILFGLQVGTQSAEPHQPGQNLVIYSWQNV